MSELDTLKALAGEREGRITEFCRGLVRTPSPPGEEGDAARLVAEEMRALGYDDVRADEVGNVIGTIRGGGGGPSVMLNTHLDHVAAGDPAGWRFPPFEAALSDGAVWGRGAMDIKGPTASQVHGAAILKAAGMLPRGDVVVAVAVQEEVGGLGSVELAKSRGADRAVVGEATSNELRLGHRGRIELIARIRGRSVHASMPDRGVNPHPSLARLVLALDGIGRLEDPVLGVETLVPTLVFSDQESSNVVPGELRLHVDWRTVPARGAEETRRALAEALDGALGEGATGEVAVKEVRLRTYTGAERDLPAAFPSFALREDDPLLAASRAALSEAFGRDVPVRRWEFATDGGHLTAAGIPSVGFGPGDETLAHTNEERVPVAQLVEAAYGYAALALRLATE